MDREALERAGTFGKDIRSLKPDIVIDMICFTKPSAEMLVKALSGQGVNLRQMPNYFVSL
ncbi:hypothetical protein C8J32_11122 [Rhizobium sp. PP-CC-3A-592]|nr:hypothetical protein C8J32_11122 [Rhizobium sp. PP-CC-3A-592]